VGRDLSEGKLILIYSLRETRITAKSKRDPQTNLRALRDAKFCVWREIETELAFHFLLKTCDAIVTAI
jgi:hypothetical protein